MIMLNVWNYLYLIHFLISSSIDVLGQYSSHKFDIQIVHLILKGTGTKDLLAKHPLSKLDYLEHVRLCRDAMEYAWKNGILLMTCNVQTELNNFPVYYLDEAWGDNLIGVRCPFTPAAIVSLANEKSEDIREMLIVVQENKFLHDNEYIFLEGVADCITAAAPEVYPRPINSFNSFVKEELWELCTAAWSRLHKSIGQSISFGNNQFGKVGTYNFEYQHNVKRNEFAVECNSSPKLYVRKPHVRTPLYNETFVAVLEGRETSQKVSTEEMKYDSDPKSEVFVSAECTTSDCNQRNNN